MTGAGARARRVARRRRGDPFVGVSRSMSRSPDMAQKVRSEINKWKVDAAGRPVSWSTFLLPASSAGQAKLPIAAEVEGAPALRDDASGVSTFAWHAPGAAPDAACRLRALRTAGDGNCLLRRRARHVGLAPPTQQQRRRTPASPTPPTPSAALRSPPPPTPTDSLGVGGDALGAGALLGPLRRLVAAVLASDKFAASLVDRLRVERGGAAPRRWRPSGAHEASDVLRADLLAPPTPPSRHAERCTCMRWRWRCAGRSWCMRTRVSTARAGVYLPAAGGAAGEPRAARARIHRRRRLGPLAVAAAPRARRRPARRLPRRAPPPLRARRRRRERRPGRPPRRPSRSRVAWSAAQPDGCPVAVVSAAPADANAMMLPAALELRRRIVGSDAWVRLCL